MRRTLALIAVAAISLSACGTGSPPASSVSATTATSSSADAMTSTSEAMMSSSEAMMSSSDAMTGSSEAMKGSSEAMTGSSEAMTEHPDSSMMTSAPTEASGSGTAIATAGSDFGPVLFDGSGQAIYLFDKETGTVPDCYDKCAAAWPPVLTVGPPTAAAGTTASLLGTTPRTDSTIQVTYAGHPLYYYAHEGKNEVKCHNVDEFGGLWLAVAPTGEAAPH